MEVIRYRMVAMRDLKKSCEVDGEKSDLSNQELQTILSSQPQPSLGTAGPFLTVQGQLMNDILECRSHM